MPQTLEQSTALAGFGLFGLAMVSNRLQKFTGPSDSCASACHDQEMSGTDLRDAFSDVAEPGTPRSPGSDSFTAPIGEAHWALQLAQLDDEAAADLLAEMEPSQAADILKDMEVTKAARCLAHMKAEVSGHIFEFMSTDIVVTTLKSMHSHESVGILSEMSAELAAKILEEMEPVLAGEVINDLPSEITVCILTQMSADVLNRILSKMDGLSRTRILQEIRQIYPNWSPSLQRAPVSKMNRLTGEVSPWKAKHPQSFQSADMIAPTFRDGPALGHTASTSAISAIQPLNGNQRQLPTPLRRRGASLCCRSTPYWAWNHACLCTLDSRVLLDCIFFLQHLCIWALMGFVLRSVGDASRPVLMHFCALFDEVSDSWTCMMNMYNLFGEEVLGISSLDLTLETRRAKYVQAIKRCLAIVHKIWEQLVLTCCQGHACIHAAQPRSRHFSRKGSCSRHLSFFLSRQWVVKHVI